MAILIAFTISIISIMNKISDSQNIILNSISTMSDKIEEKNNKNNISSSTTPYPFPMNTTNNPENY